MRTLVVITAQVRSHAITWESTLRNLIEPLRADLAVCAAFSQGIPDRNPVTEAAQWLWPHREVDDFGIYYDQICLDRGWPRMERAKLMAVRDQWLGGIDGPGRHSGSSGIVLLFKQLTLDHILRNGLDRVYDRFIITRIDHFHGAAHPSMETLDPSKVWVPNGSDSGGAGICDRHWVLSPQHLEPCLRLVDPMLKDPDALVRAMSHMTCWNPEAYIRLIWSMNGIMPMVRRYPRSMYLVRGPGDATRWQVGTYNAEAGMVVKYADEYQQFKSDQCTTTQCGS